MFRLESIRAFPLSCKPLCYWLIHLTVSFMIGCWILIDPHLIRTINEIQTLTDLAQSGRGYLFGFLVSVSGICLLRLTWGLAWGVAQYRTLKAMLGWVFMVAVTLGLVSQLSEIAFQGKRLRLAQQLKSFDLVASGLQKDWPDCDGDRLGLGPYMAYPEGAPRMLLLLTPSTIGAPEMAVGSIEKSAPGSLRFQLTGLERGDWLEWHPEGIVPASFVGGLQNKYDIERSASLRGRWFLVRYRSAHSLSR